MKRILIAAMGAVSIVGWTILTLIVSQWAASQWTVTTIGYDGERHADGSFTGILMFLVMTAAGALIGWAIVREYIDHDH